MSVRRLLLATAIIANAVVISLLIWKPIGRTTCPPPPPPHYHRGVVVNRDTCQPRYYYRFSSRELVAGTVVADGLVIAWLVLLPRRNT